MRLVLVLFFVFVLFFNVCACEKFIFNGKYVSGLSITGNRTKNVQTVCYRPRRNIEDLWKMIPLHIMENSNSISLKCSTAYKRYLKGLRENDIESSKMFDATAKLPSGILSGNVNQYGNFDQCMEITEAQYCLAEIDIEKLWLQPYVKFKDLAHSNFLIRETLDDPKHRVPGFTMIRWGFCIPQECTNVDLENALKEKLGVQSMVKTSMCQNIEIYPQASLGEYIAKSWFFVIAVLTIISSILYFRGIRIANNDAFCKKLLMCFTIQTNYTDFTANKTSSKDIQALHGVRALSAIALLVSHKTMALLYNPYINRTEMTQGFGQRWSVIGRTAILYTECFMLLSGLLNANSLFIDLDKSKTMKFKEKVINRIFRILPNLITVILFCTFVLPHLGSGPLWPLVVNHHAGLCKKYMWRNMLFIHNYYGFKDMCLTHTHQVGIDMQLFLVTPLFVYIIWKNRRVGLWTIGITAVVSTLLRFWVTWQNELSHVVHFGMPISRMFRTADLSYILPTHRATIYLMGVTLAYILRYFKHEHIFTKRQLHIIWSILYVCGVSIWLGPVSMSTIGFEYDKLTASFYGAVSPILWGSAVAWVIYAVDRGFGNWFSPVLTWKYFVPFTKIAYAVYLVQFPVFFYNVGKTRHTGEYSPYMMMQVVETGTILMFSCLLTLLIEIPFQNVRKIVFEKDCTAVKTHVELRTQENSNRRSKLG